MRDEILTRRPARRRPRGFPLSARPSRISWRSARLSMSLGAKVPRRRTKLLGVGGEVPRAAVPSSNRLRAQPGGDRRLRRTDERTTGGRRPSESSRTRTTRERYRPGRIPGAGCMGRSGANLSEHGTQSSNRIAGGVRVPRPQVEMRVDVARPGCPRVPSVPGQGSRRAPKLWLESSFVDGSGESTRSRVASRLKPSRDPIGPGTGPRPTIRPQQSRFCLNS